MMGDAFTAIVVLSDFDGALYSTLRPRSRHENSSNENVMANPWPRQNALEPASSTISNPYLGNVKKNVEPTSTVDSTQMRPL